MLSVILVLLGLVVCCTGDGTCLSPDPVKPFDYNNYMGVWYEIGKIQTNGGAKYQATCVCTFSEMTPSKAPNAAPSDANVVYSCRNRKPTGRFLNTSAILTEMDPPGVWTETFFPGTPLAYDVNYFVIDMDIMGNEFAMEYDCDESDYCVHFFARRPEIDGDLIRALVEKAVAMGLNPLNLPFRATNHDGCWPEKD